MKRAFNLYKSAYGGLSPATWWLSLVMLVNRCGTMVLPFMTLYLTENKHVSIGEAGFVMALFGAGSIVGGFLGGRLTDKIGFYYIQLIALMGGGVMFFILGHAESYSSICIVTFLLSLVNEAFRPANSAAVAYYSEERNRTRSFSLNRLAINLGWALGGGLGGFIAAYDYHLLFWIDGFSNIGAAILLWAVLGPSKSRSRQAQPKSPVHAGSIPSAYRDKPYLIFIVLTTVFAYCFFQLFTTLPLFYKQGLGLEERYIGGLMAMNGLVIAAIEMVMVFKIEGRRNDLHFVFYGVLLVGLSFGLYNLLIAPALLAVLCMLLATFGEMFSMSFMNSYWANRSLPENRGQYAGLYAIAWSSAQVLGPGTGALIADKYGFAVLWWILAGFCLIAALGFKWLQRKEESLPYQQHRSF